MGFAGLMLLFLWWGYLRERVYLYFSIALTAAAMGTARSFISDPGIDNLTVERIIPALVLLICLGISGSLIDFNEIRSRIYQFWWPAGSLFLVALFITPVSMLASTAIAVYGFGLASISVTIFEVIHHLRKDSVRAQKILFVSITFIFLIAIHDYLVQIRILTYTDRPLIQYAIPILLIGLMMRLLSRHAEALSVAERAKRELEERVSIITGEIERSYQESVGMLRASAARDERERIARDLHDDLGARLLTLVHRSHDEKTSESAREALADLRLLIGHLNQPEGSLDEAISDWRAETQDRCDAANRTLNWQITSISPCPLGTRQKITLGRILRESVTNILKHTDSPVITICILEKGGQLHMDIMDASLSTPVHTWRQGTGMRNLEMRAQQIGADLTWLDETTADGVKTGTRVRCQIPVRALNAAIMEPKK